MIPNIRVSQCLNGSKRIKLNFWSGFWLSSHLWTCLSSCLLCMFTNCPLACFPFSWVNWFILINDPGLSWTLRRIWIFDFDLFAWPYFTHYWDSDFRCLGYFFGMGMCYRDVFCCACLCWGGTITYTHLLSFAIIGAHLLSPTKSCTYLACTTASCTHLLHTASICTHPSGSIETHTHASIDIYLQLSHQPHLIPSLSPLTRELLYTLLIIGQSVQPQPAGAAWPRAYE